MKQTTLMSALFLAVTLALMCNTWADDDDDEVIEYECCCEMLCEYNWSIIGFVRLGEHGEESYFVSECEDMELSEQSRCESESHAKAVCNKYRNEVYLKILDQIVPSDYPLKHLIWPLITYAGNEGMCFITEKGGECPVDILLGPDVPRINTLRQFRDEVLAITVIGRQLTELYYEYADVLTEIIEENPAIRGRAKELLVKIIPMIEALLDGSSKGIVLTDEISAEADMLIEEIDAVLASPLKETLTKLREDIEKDGI